MTTAKVISPLNHLSSIKGAMVTVARKLSDNKTFSGAVLFTIYRLNSVCHDMGNMPIFLMHFKMFVFQADFVIFKLKASLDRRIRIFFF